MNTDMTMEMEFMQKASGVCFGAAVGAMLLSALLFFLFDIRTLFLIETGYTRWHTVRKMHKKQRKKKALNPGKKGKSVLTEKMNLYLNEKKQGCMTEKMDLSLNEKKQGCTTEKMGLSICQKTQAEQTGKTREDLPTEKLPEDPGSCTEGITKQSRMKKTVYFCVLFIAAICLSAAPVRAQTGHEEAYEAAGREAEEAGAYTILYFKNAEDAVGAMLKEDGAGEASGMEDNDTGISGAQTGGEGGGTAPVPDGVQNRAYGDGKALLPNGFSRRGYSFAGWNTEADRTGAQYEDRYEGDLADEAGAVVMLYAQWKANEYTVRFHSNDAGEGMPEEKIVEQSGFLFGIPAELETDVFSRQGYSHPVWATERDGSGDACEWFGDGETVLNLAEEDGAVIDLYAVWIDTAPVEISLKKSQAYASSSCIDFDSERVVYTVLLQDQDGGSGVDPDAVYYAVGKDGMDVEEIDDWVRIPAEDVVLEENGKRYSASFQIEYEKAGPVKGAVFVKAQDRAVKEKKAYKIAGEKEVESSSGVENAPNVKCMKLRNIVLEKAAPVIELRVHGQQSGGQQTDPEGAAKDHVFSCRISDPAAEPSADSSGEDDSPSENPVTEDPAADDPSGSGGRYSGIAQAVYSLQKVNEDGSLSDVNGYTGIVFVDHSENGSHLPETLEETFAFQNAGPAEETIRGAAHTIGGIEFPALNGRYRLKVTACDFCGNSSETTAETDLLFDNTPPYIAVRMEGGKQDPEDGTWFYNGTEGQNLTVTFGGENDLTDLKKCLVRLSGKARDDGKELTKTFSLETETGRKTGTLTVEAGTIRHVFEDGIITLTAFAEDIAGNRTEILEKEETSLSFVLDTAAPEIAVTMSGGGHDGSEYYYRRDNCGITISVGSEADAARLYTVDARVYSCGDESDEEPVNGRNAGSDDGRDADSGDGPNTESDDDRNHGRSEKASSIYAGGKDYKTAITVISVAADELRRLPDGRVAVRVTAEDYAGNRTNIISVTDSAGLKVEKSGNRGTFILDRTAPALSVRMSGGKKHADENGYYYRADNCGLTVEIGSGEDTTAIFEYMVRVRNKDSCREISQELRHGTAGQSDSRLVRKIPSKKEAVQTSPAPAKTVTVRFSREEMQKLGDGHIEVTARAKDYSLNENGSFAETVPGGDRQDSPKEDGQDSPKEAGRDDAGEKNGISGLKDAGGDRKKAVFVLDMTEPVVTEIRTDARAKGRSRDGRADAIPYDEGKSGSFYYYNDKNVATAFTIRDVNLFEWTVSYKKNGHTITQEKVRSEAVVTRGTGLRTQEVSALYYDMDLSTVSAEGRYTQICVLGADKAGNPLILSTDYKYTGKGKNEVDSAKSSVKGSGNGKKGVVTLQTGKVIDRTAPVAALTYSTDATAYLYNDEIIDGAFLDMNDTIVKTAAGKNAETNVDHYSLATAYVNKAFRVSVRISDTYDGAAEAVHLDFDKLTVRQCGKEPVRLTEEDIREKNGRINGDFAVYPGRDSAADGAYYYKIYGTDRAGNALTVRESMSSQVRTERIRLAKSYETKGCDTTCHAKFRFVLDTVKPVFSFTLPDPKGNETVDGNTAYYGSSAKKLSGTFTVMDGHLDPARIGAGFALLEGRNAAGDEETAGSGTDDQGAVRDGAAVHYSEIKLSWSDVKLEYGFSGSQRKNTVQMVLRGNREGVYRFGIAGEDKAGNPVIQSAEEASKSGYQATLPVQSGKNGSFWTFPKVLDRTAPAGELLISAQKQGYGKTENLNAGEGDTGVYYRVAMDSLGNNTLDTKQYAPYRKERKAFVSVTSGDLSPVRITYGIESTIGGQNRKYEDAVYENGSRKSTSVSGEQVFQVTDLLLIDRAGNRTGFYRTGRTKANKIYLDTTPPAGYDVDRPQAAVTVTDKVTAGAADGRDLFNRGIDLQIRVVDPYENVRSSGLKACTYETRVDGKRVSELSGIFDGNTEKALLYHEEELVYSFSKKLSVPSGGRFETNDIEITVNARDNAGNTAETVTYRFGIDTKGPEIIVTFDNNSARNGFYFKESRTASVEVKERNVDDEKIRIRTQVDGGRFRNVYHSGNGNNDLWRRTLSYTADGNYTLDISGTDASGNPVTVSYAGQTAPRKFTIDKTPPDAIVTFDNNDVRNGKYYRALRTAFISIEDANFAGENDILVEAAGGERIPGEVIFSGNAASIRFAGDGTYVFNGSVTDLAGNRTVLKRQKEFVIDTKAPVLTFEDGQPFKVVKASAEELAFGRSDHPVDMQFFSEGGFAPAASVTDVNISTAEQDAVFRITGTKPGNDHTSEIVLREDNDKNSDINDDKNVDKRKNEGGNGSSTATFDMVFSPRLFEVKEEVDDVYEAVAYAVDLAGNKSEEVTFTFSINRFGSNFKIASGETNAFLRDSYYHNETVDLEIHEYNTNAIIKDSQEIEVMKDGNTALIRKLVPGKDYDFIEDRASGSSPGGRIYKYTIHSSVFEKEGEYSFTISSEDEAGHRNTTSRIHRAGKGETQVVSFPIDFVIDKTPPLNRLAGVKEERKQSFHKGSLLIDVLPEDGQTGIRQVEIRRWETDPIGFRNPAGMPLDSITYAYYDEENPAPEASMDRNGIYREYADLTDFADEVSGRIRIVYELKESRNWQWIEIITTDLAGNESTDYRAGSAGASGYAAAQGFPNAKDPSVLEENRQAFLVTTDAFTQIINNRAARIGTAAAAAMLLIFLIFRLRKRKEAGDAVDKGIFSSGF